MDKIIFTMGDRQVNSTLSPSYAYYPLEFSVVVKRTWYNRMRFWLFFKFFPFEFSRWEKTTGGGNAT